MIVRDLNLDDLRDVSDYLSFFVNWELNYDCTVIYLNNLDWIDKMIGIEDNIKCNETLDIWYEKENKDIQNKFNIKKINSFFIKQRKVL